MDRGISLECYCGAEYPSNDCFVITAGVERALQEREMYADRAGTTRLFPHMAGDGHGFIFTDPSASRSCSWPSEICQPIILSCP